MANVSLIANIADQTASQAANGSAQLVPTGVILSYGGANAPTGWLLCDGRAISRTTFAGLFAVLSTSFGVGDGSTTFNLPDLRGRFPRYDDNMGNHGISGVTASGAASRDTGRVHGSAQVDATKRPTTAFTSGSSSTSGSVGGSDGAHTHTMTSSSFMSGNSCASGSNAAAVGSGGGTYGTTVTNSGHGHGFSLTAAGQSVTGGGDAETRPINVAVNAIIKI